MRLERCSIGLTNWQILRADATADWSDSWSDEDLADATAAAVRRFEDEERESLD